VSALRARVERREPLTGTVLTLPGATAAELLAEPFDLVWVDLEHGALGRHEVQEMVLGAQAVGTAALVRLPADDHGAIGAVLDAGADGVVLAAVDSAMVAAAGVAATVLPPLGERGYGPRRAGLRGRSAPRPAWQPSVWVQIETAAGVAAAREIAAIDGVDALVVGTADLSFALGVPLDFAAPELTSAVSLVRDAATAAGRAFGVAGALLDAPRALTTGAQVLVHSTDARLCASAVDGAALRLHTLFSSEAKEPSTP
jgi:4-hydroxy-2-oxoheptanedioate aldolase